MPSGMTQRFERRISTRGGLIAVALLLLMPLLPHAATSGLALIPTADTLGKNTWGFEFQLDTDLSSFRQSSRFLNTEVCLGESLELGADFDFSEGVVREDRVLFNVKFVFAENGPFAAAAGVRNITAEGRGYPFLVGKWEFEKLHLHGGLLQSDAEEGRRTRWCAGFDLPLTERLAAMGDYTSGSERASSLALTWTPNDRWGGLLGVQFPQGGDEPSLTIHIWITGRHKAGGPHHR